MNIFSKMNVLGMISMCSPVVFAIILGFALYLPMECPAATQVITVGALLDLTGANATFGETVKTVLEMALEDFNNEFPPVGVDGERAYRMEALVLDTGSVPQTALNQMQSFSTAGIKVVLGPLTSAELEAIKDYANQNGIMIVSPSSTAVSLSIAEDNVFRLVPDDKHQALAAALLMHFQGIKALTGLYVDDVFGRELTERVSWHMDLLGHDVPGSVSFAPGTTDFTSQLAQLNTWVEQAAQTNQYKQIAVYLIAFDECVPILQQASQYPSLARVHWYGSDASARNQLLIENSVASEFAISTCFANPIFGGNVTESPKFLSLQQRTEAQSGNAVNAHALVMYDALHLVASAYQHARQDTSLETLKREFVRLAGMYYGATGATILNEAGDRTLGDYDYWGVQKEGTVYSWTRRGFFLDTWGSFPDFLYFETCTPGQEGVTNFAVYSH